jgi:cyclophilin family peptidyl-prolyl cis-trans isomerase
MQAIIRNSFIFRLGIAITVNLLLMLTAQAQGGSAEAQPVVVLETTLGDITLQLDAIKAPVTVKNFLDYVDRKYYDGTVFHRVIPRFMVQGGGFDTDMQQRSTAPPITNESQNGLHNERGTVAMARTQNPNSATAQFFINLKMNLALDAAPGRPGYAVFGRVIDGMDVADEMVLMPTGSVDGHQDVPVEPIIIKRAYRR